MDAFSGRIGTAFSGDAVDDAPTLLETAHFHPIDKSIGAIAAFFYPRATVKIFFFACKGLAPRCFLHAKHQIKLNPVRTSPLTSCGLCPGEVVKRCGWQPWAFNL